MFSELLKEKESITLNSIIPQKGENNLNFINNEYIQLNSTKYINKINDGFTISYIDPVTLTL